MRRLSFVGLAGRNLRYHWRIHSGVFAGILLTTAVITGALILGDSTRFTLRNIAVARLAGAHYACQLPNRYFEASLAHRMAEEGQGVPAALLRLQGMALQSGAPDPLYRVNRVQVLGVDDAFWQLSGTDAPQWNAQEVIVNEHLARALHAGRGDRFALRVVKPGLMAFDAPLSPGGDAAAIRVQVKVGDIVSDNGAGRFNLNNEQRTPHNVFVPLRWLQELVDLEGKANLLLAGETWSEGQLQAELKKVMHLRDAGFQIRALSDQSYLLESERIFLDRTIADAALTLPQAEGSLAYLVNSISGERHSTPYSFAVADASLAQLNDEEAIINRWTAEKLDVSTGDTITVRWFVVTPSNEFQEQARRFRIKEIWSMEALEKAREAIPLFPGLIDVESCTDWDIGMPMDEAALKDKDNEDYWNQWRQTPKLWVNLSAGQKMWGSRFGQYTAIHFPAGWGNAPALEKALLNKISPEMLGIRFNPVREEALHSVDQALDLGQLFLGMSFFLIFSAVLLSVLLFTFSLQQRASEMGTLLALGFPPSRIWVIFSIEAALLAVAGATAGMLAGAGYAALLLQGLRHAWAGAVAGTMILFHLKLKTLFSGFFAGAGIPLLAVCWTVWRQCRRPVRELLHRDFSQKKALTAAGRPGRLAQGLAFGGLLAGLIAVAAVFVIRPAATAPFFFTTGAWLLGFGIYAWYLFLRSFQMEKEGGSLSLNKLALQQLTRRPGRNTSAAALLACGVFIAISVISMQEDLGKHAAERSSGTGGFALFGETTAALTEAPKLEGIDAVALRLRQGDDAGCLNLTRAAVPGIYGVDPAVMKKRGAFDKDADGASVWSLLEQESPDGAIPALVGDMDTAMWGLKAKTHPEKGDVLYYSDDEGKEISVRLVGALPMRLSVFQGSILISLDNFTRIFPSESGFRAFLFDSQNENTEETIRRLHRQEEKSGMQVETTLQRLEHFYAVERSYLSLFLVLGVLGVTLGALGIGVITARSRIERRAEWAMLQVLGYEKRHLLRLLVVENAAILLVAAILGGSASLTALLPSVLLSSTTLPLLLQFIGFLSMLAGGALSVALALLVTRSQSLLLDLRRE